MMILGNLNPTVSSDFHIRPVRLWQEAVWPWITTKFRAVLTPRVFLSWYVPQTSNSQLCISQPQNASARRPQQARSGRLTAARAAPAQHTPQRSGLQYENSAWLLSIAITTASRAKLFFLKSSWRMCFDLCSVPVRLITDSYRLWRRLRTGLPWRNTKAHTAACICCLAKLSVCPHLSVTTWHLK